MQAHTYPTVTEILIIFFRHIRGTFHQYIGRNNLFRRLRATDRVWARLLHRGNCKAWDVGGWILCSFAPSLTTSKIRAMTGHFINAAISVSLKSSMCYLHCTESLDASDVDPTVFTIDVNPVTRCQAQCWQNWDQTKQLKMCKTCLGTHLSSSKKYWLQSC